MAGSNIAVPFGACDDDPSPELGDVTVPTSSATGEAVSQLA
jgi:hypothetical protein